jgi:hypothetical protein
MNHEVHEGHEALRVYPSFVLFVPFVVEKEHLSYLVGAAFRRPGMNR